MKRPNVLLITSDQHHWSLLGCQTPQLQTPALDRLAREGTVFERAYCPNPTCTPTRASIITGQYPSQHGAWTLGTKLDEKVRTVGEEFQANGYRTGLVGKAHFQPLKGTGRYPSLEAYPLLQDLDYFRHWNGPFYGFQHVELARNHTDEAHVGQHYALWLEAQGAKDWRRWFRAPTGTRPGGEGAWDIPNELHYNTWIAERTEALLTEYRDQDDGFFLWSSFFDPHPSYLVPEPWASMYDPASIPVPALRPGELATAPELVRLARDPEGDWKPFRESGFGLHGCHYHGRSDANAAASAATYWGMVSCMDAAIGRILDTLDRLGLAENTLVIFTTDHGHLYGQHGLHAKGPFHYEDLLKVPFIARHPGRIPAGQRSQELVSLVDLAPTALSWCDIEVPVAMTGIDQSPVLRGEAKPTRDHVLCEFRHDPTSIYLKTFVDERHKLTIHYNRTYGELHDLVADPDELVNLWDDPASQGLKQRLIERFLHAELGAAPMAMPRVASA